MRIIAHGDQYEIGEKECPFCHCKFAYNKKDTKEIYDREDECDITIVFCPECKESIHV